MTFSSQTKGQSAAGHFAMMAGLFLGGCAPSVQLDMAPSLMSSALDDERAPPLQADALATSWTAFGSAELESMIERGRKANPDIAIAAARIMQARGDLGVVKASKLPEITASAGASSDIRNLKGQTASLDRIGSASIDISYDLDLFGGSKAGRKAAWARLKAAGDDQDAIRLAIEAEIATAFVEYAALSDRAVLMKKAADNARELERIIRIRAREGVAGAVEVGLQTTEGNAIEISASRIMESRAVTKNAIAVLLGEEAPYFAMQDATLDALRVPYFDIVQTAEIVARRPDIRAAEARIAAANGDVAQARAAFMPSIQLSASSFFDIARTGGIINAGASAGFGLLATIFDNGRLKSRLFRASGEQKEAVQNYRKLTLTALAEAQNALVAANQTQKRYALLVESSDLAEKTANAARRQYLEGKGTMNVVLDADRRLVEVQESLVLAKQESLNAAIILYRALGGAPRASGVASYSGL